MNENHQQCYRMLLCGPEFWALILSLKWHHQLQISRDKICLDSFWPLIHRKPCCPYFWATCLWNLASLPCVIWRNSCSLVLHVYFRKGERLRIKAVNIHFQELEGIKTEARGNGRYLFFILSWSWTQGFILAEPAFSTWAHSSSLVKCWKLGLWKSSGVTKERKSHREEEISCDCGTVVCRYSLYIWYIYVCGYSLHICVYVYDE